MYCFGGLHTDAHVWSLCIVKVYYPIQYRPAFIPCRYSHLVQPLDFQYAVGTFRDGVFEWVAALGHAYIHMAFLQLLYIFIAAILTPAIRVMDEPGCRDIINRSQCHFQGI